MKKGILNEFEAKIYTLNDKDGNVFYVGCTAMDIETRLDSHLSGARCCVKYGFPNVNKKNITIIENGFNVSATIVDIKKVICKSRKEAIKLAAPFEAAWIAKFLSEGIKLTNSRNLLPKPSTAQFIGKTVKAA